MMWTTTLLADGMARDMGFSYVGGEVKELLESKSLGEAYSEFNDVCACTLLAITNLTGIALPILRGFGKKSAEGWYERLGVWRDIFWWHGVSFSPAYLSGGSNYRKKSKIVKAFAASGFEGDIDWFEINDYLKGWEEE